MSQRYWARCRDRFCVARHARLQILRALCARLLTLVATTVLFLMLGIHAGAAPSANEKIVFLSTRAGGSWQVFIMNMDGSDPKRLTNIGRHSDYPRGAYTTPDLRADGRQVLFGAYTPDGLKKGDRGIYMMNMDGSRLHRVTDLQAEEASFSPDGRRIAFVALDREKRIYIMNVDGSNLVDTGRVGYSPAWSPDGHRLAFTCGYEICAMNDDGSNFVQLTDDRPYSMAPQFSPDGRTIVFQSLHGSIGPWFEISLMAADGSNVRRLSPPGWIGESPSFTPDGRFVFVSQTAHATSTGNPSYSNRQIYIINVDGTNLRRLTGPPGENAFAPFGYLY